MNKTTHAPAAFNPLRKAARLLAATACLLLPWAAHANNWQPCATEGQICNVQGAASVRFGTNGNYEYRNVNGPIPCNTQTFGDPAKGEVKRCEYSPGHNAPSNTATGGPFGQQPGGWVGSSGQPGRANNNNNGWQVCALEGETCRFRGSREVRFGAADSYAVRTANGGIDCDVRTFGDPAPGLRKMCLVRTDAPWSGNGNGNASDQGNPGNWRFCAEEDQQCRPPRGATVRFGANGQYAYLNRVNGSVACHVNTFGDPAQGERKRCEYSTTSNGFNGGSNTGGGWLGGNNPPNGAPGNWVYCAEEDGECRVPYPTTVRFGADGRFHTLQVNASVPCTPSVFGDPAKGERKRCEYAR